MRRIIVCLTFAVILAASCSVPAYSASSWNVADEIARLGREAPPLSAFPGTPGVVWMSSDRYSLTSEGGKEHYGIYLILLGEEAEGNAITSRRFPYPAEEGATLEITEAAWYDTNGARLGDLPTRKYDINGVGGIEVEFPDEAYGLVAAIAFHENVPGRYYLDDVLSLAGELPIWEQIVTVEVPDGMTVYWDGVGVMNPERVRNGRTELMTWTVLNEPAWRGTGMTDSGKPSLSFSLEHGYIAMLKNMKELEKAPYSPPIPSSVSLYRSNVFKAAGSVAKYMASRSIASERGTDIVRHFEDISSDGPWTGWEQVMIASKWMSSLGFKTQIYWAQSIPAGSDGPASPKIWREPILRISDVGGREIYYKAGQNGNSETMHPSLFGQTLYRIGNAGIERLTLPRGFASDHIMRQNWKTSINENGTATGTLEITLTGAWLDVFAIDIDNLPSDMTGVILEAMRFNVPGITFETTSVKLVESGCRIIMSVNAAPGIVSGSSMLLKLMGGIPNCFEEIPTGGTKYTLRFPFIFEINSSISTPKGYRALDLPGKLQAGSSSEMLEQSVVHWPKRALAEATCRWTVRAPEIDEYTSGRVSDHIAMVNGWPDVTVPLRKR